MSAIFPTGRPWQVKHDFDLEGRTTIIGNVDGEIIDGTTHNTFDFVCSTIDEADDSQSQSVAVANADFIVRAVNAHDALVAALDAIAGGNQRPGHVAYLTQTTMAAIAEKALARAKAGA